MREAFQIQQLRVERMYGVRHDGVAADELSVGVNVVHGTNGRGKTTFGRAVQGMIWPRFLTDWRPTVSGAFLYGGAQWTIDIEDGRLRYQRDGDDAQPSALPEESHRERYWLSLHELIDRDRGKSFAEQIRDLALGGQNVADAARGLAFTAASGRLAAATRRLSEVSEELGRVRRGQQDLRRRERGLHELERQREEAEEAARRADFIERVIDLNRAHDAAEEARLALEELPEILASVRVDDAERIEKNLNEEKSALEQRDEAVGRLDAAREGLGGNLIAKAGRPEVSLADFEHRQRAVADLERVLKQTEQDIAKAEARIAEAWQAIAADGREEAVGNASAETLKAIDALVAEREALRQKQEALKSLREILGVEPAADLQTAQERLSEGIRTLGEWLREARSADEQSPHVFSFAVGSATLFLVAGLVATLLWHPAAILALIASLVFAVIAGMARRRGTSDPRIHEERFAALSLDPPRSWSVPEVRNHQRELETQRADVALRLEKARRRDALPNYQDELDADRRLLDERAAVIGKELGLEAPLSGSQLIIFARNLVAWQQCRMEHAGLAKKADQVKEQIRAELATFNQNVAPLSLPPAIDASAAMGVVDTLREAQAELVSLDQEMRTADRDMKAAEELARRCRTSIRAICERLKIEEEGAQVQAMRLCDQLSEYRERYRVRGEKSAVAEKMRKDIEAHPAFNPDLLKHAEVELVRLLRASREQAAALNDVVEELGGIRREVQKAQQEHDLERALAEHDEAVEALRREYRTACAQSIGKLLSDYVDEESRETQLPPVFHRAKELFAAFSHNHYDLRFDPRDASFRGFDTVRQRGVKLDELSSGTRVQLLLAVRIAFVEQLEQGCKLPILFDEALANSDDGRAEAIIGAVLELCRQGRQVFYFTAQDDEVLKWKRVLQEHGDIDHAFIALPGDCAAEVDERALPAPPMVRAIPPVNSHSREAYGHLLNVPRWTGWDDVGTLHAWYLEPRLERLHALLEKSYERWGQLASLLRHGAIDLAGYDQTSIAPLAAKAKALEMWQELWRIGRGRPVDRNALEACDAVSSTFIDRIHERCLEVGKDGRALLDSLYERPIQRFVGQREGLEEHLLAEGYIEEVSPLPEQDLRVEVLGRMHGKLDRAGLTAADLGAFLEDVRCGPQP